MSTEEKYVAAAYLIVFAFVLVYFLIMALKLARLERDLHAAEDTRKRQAEDQRTLDEIQLQLVKGDYERGVR